MKYFITAISMNGVCTGELVGDWVTKIGETEMPHLSDKRIKEWAFPLIENHMRLAADPSLRYGIYFDLGHNDLGTIISGEVLMDEFVAWLLDKATAEMEVSENDQISDC